MKAMFALLLLAAAGPACASVAAASGGENPLGAVLSLLDELTGKIQKEGEAEAKAYAEFVEWCDDASKNKQFEIQTGTAKKEKLEATIAKSADDSAAAASKIEDLAGSISSDEGDLKDATVIRKKEAADFLANENELMDVISKLGRAIGLIDREMKKNPAAFAQVDTSSIDGLIKSLGAVTDAAAFSIADKERLAALVQAKQGAGSDDADDMGAPDPAAYKSHSSNVLDVLEDLKEKAEEQLGALRKAETNAKHNFEMLAQSLRDQIAADTKNMDEEKTGKASAEETKAAATGDHASTVKSLADSKATLETANGNCMTTAADHEATMKGREEELATIAQAKKLLLDSTSGATSQTYSFLQQSAASALRTRADLANAEVVTLVRRLAREQHSAALAQLASQVAAVVRYGASAGVDPFSKVKSLISDMIAKLQAEANGEATEKAYCDEETAKSEAKKGELSADVAKLTAKIDQQLASSAGLKEDVKELQSELAALTKAQAEMDKIRHDSHAAYSQAKADLEQGLQGVRKALGMLRDYYANGGGASSALLQQGDAQPAAPEKHEKASGAGSSIIGILEVCESDFAKNLAKEEAEEADAAAECEKTTQENKISKALKEQDVKYKTQEFKGLDQSIAELSSDREGTNTELAAVLEYYDKLKDRCIAKPETYEERKRRRETEITGLREALEVLESETALTQRGKRGFRGRHFLHLRPSA